MPLVTLDSTTPPWAGTQELQSTAPFYAAVMSSPTTAKIAQQRLPKRLNIPEPERFSEVLDNTMNKLVAEAADTPSGAKKYATREANFSGLQTLYSLVQCTRDISSSDRNRCLARAAALLPSCYARQQGANILYSSCNLRYEVYPFYRIQAATPSPTPPSTTGAGGNDNISPTIIIAICAPIAIVLLLFSVWCYWQRRRVKDKYNAIRNDQSGRQPILLFQKD
ncbi:Gnk2-like domain containing protein [Trema orientale]|uniref:Gnk2-like domain containing protein n=1 Tax=Trema orientale TaxID=63057 RepID=A0A2P5ERH6_TREOI|nr:Gnk2-like domain containing protein [Trema orientale]